MTALRAAVRCHWLDPIPSQAVSRINHSWYESRPLERSVGFFMARLDVSSGRLTYSDGVTETFNGSGDEFGEDSLVQLVERVRHLDAAGMQAEILREIELFAPGVKATRDRTLIVLKRN
jgi:serine phosphatase RsbU (regulator of sigma subunit)